MKVSNMIKLTLVIAAVVGLLVAATHKAGLTNNPNIHPTDTVVNTTTNFISLGIQAGETKEGTTPCFMDFAFALLSWFAIGFTIGHYLKLFAERNFNK